MNRAAKALFPLVFFAAACKSGRPLVLINRELPARSAEKIIERVMDMRTPPPRYYTAKASIEMTLGDNARSFKAQLRCVRDSALWASLVPALGIEVARVLITPDSLKAMDKIHDQYFIGDTADAKKRFGLFPDLTLLQDALMGIPIGLDPAEKYRSDREDGQYVLTSREKRRFVRAAEDISPGDTLAHDRDMGERRLERTLRRAEEKEAVVHRYWVEPDSFQVTRVQVVDLVHDRTADVRYEERGDLSVGHLPVRVRITFSEPGRLASGLLEISRIDLGGPLQLNFRIPEKYEPMP